MANLKQATTPPKNLKSMQPVSSLPVVRGPSGIPPVALTGLGVTSIGPIPALLGTTYDTIRQWIRPSNNPQYRIFPMPVKASLQANAVANSAASQSVTPATSVPFNDVTTGINNTLLTVGIGGVLEASGTGVIDATEINGIPITGALTHAGMIPISQPGNTEAVWADPFVQGVYAPGTNVTTGGVSGGPINPVLIGAQNPSNLLENLRVDASNNLFVTGTFSGNKTNNNAAPSTDNIAALVALANASAPSNTEGKLVLLSVDLAGNLRVVTSGGGGTQYASGTAVATPTGNAILGWDGTDVRVLLCDSQGYLLTRPAAPTAAKWSQAPINCSSAGTNVLIAGVGGQTIRVMRIFFVNSDPTTITNVTIQDTTPTSFSGAFRLITGGSFNGTDADGEPLYVSAVGKGIQLNSSAAVQLSGTIWYTIS